VVIAIVAPRITTIAVFFSDPRAVLPNHSAIDREDFFIDASYDDVILADAVVVKVGTTLCIGP